MFIEYFIECIDILAPFICDILVFNAVFNSDCYTEEWFNCKIVPLHKKGDKTCVDNYSGITLLSCLAPLFTSVLNIRIERFCGNNSSISNAQFGLKITFNRGCYLCTTINRTNVF